MIWVLMFHWLVLEIFNNFLNFRHWFWEKPRSQDARMSKARDKTIRPQYYNMTYSSSCKYGLTQVLQFWNIPRCLTFNFNVFDFNSYEISMGGKTCPLSLCLIFLISINCSNNTGSLLLDNHAKRDKNLENLSWYGSK